MDRLRFPILQVPYLLGATLCIVVIFTAKDCMHPAVIASVLALVVLIAAWWYTS